MPDLSMFAHEPWLWLGGSFLTAVLWTNLAWLFSPWAEAERSSDAPASLAERIVHRTANWRFGPRLFQGLRLLYYIGLPSAALFWGRDAVVSRFLGLQPLVLPDGGASSIGGSLSANWSAWVEDLGWAAVLGLGTGGLLALAGFARSRAVSNLDRDASSDGALPWRTARETLYQETHWAFYRNAPIAAFGLYWGTWAGLALVALEAVINPMWREDLREPDLAWQRLSQGAVAVLSSLLFLRTQNVWLALLLHWGIAWTFRSYAASPPVLSTSAASRR